MTNKEAIKILKENIGICRFNPMTGEGKPMNKSCEETAQAMEIAIEAIEKKSGKWIASETARGGSAFGFTEIMVLEYACSNCDVRVDVSEGCCFKYCPNCGAKME